MTVSAKKVRVAINGFGRIGRQFLRCLEGREDSNLELVAVNDSGGVKQACHLTKYDSTMGTFSADIKVRLLQQAQWRAAGGQAAAQQECGSSNWSRGAVMAAVAAACARWWLCWEQQRLQLQGGRGTAVQGKGQGCLGCLRL